MENHKINITTVIPVHINPSIQSSVFCSRGKHVNTELLMHHIDLFLEFLKRYLAIEVSARTLLVYYTEYGVATQPLYNLSNGKARLVEILLT